MPKTIRNKISRRNSRKNFKRVHRKNSKRNSRKNSKRNQSKNFKRQIKKKSKISSKSLKRNIQKGGFFNTLLERMKKNLKSENFYCSIMNIPDHKMKINIEIIGIRDQYAQIQIDCDLFNGTTNVKAFQTLKSTYTKYRIIIKKKKKDEEEGGYPLPKLSTSKKDKIYSNIIFPHLDIYSLAYKSGDVNPELIKFNDFMKENYMTEQFIKLDGEESDVDDTKMRIYFDGTHLSRAQKGVMTANEEQDSVNFNLFRNQLKKRIFYAICESYLNDKDDEIPYASSGEIDTELADRIKKLSGDSPPVVPLRKDIREAEIEIMDTTQAEQQLIQGKKFVIRKSPSDHQIYFVTKNSDKEMINMKITIADNKIIFPYSMQPVIEPVINNLYFPYNVDYQ